MPLWYKARITNPEGRGWLNFDSILFQTIYFCAASTETVQVIIIRLVKVLVSDSFSLGLDIETLKISVSVSVSKLRLRKIKSRSRSRKAKSGLATLWPEYQLVNVALGSLV